MENKKEIWITVDELKQTKVQSWERGVYLGFVLGFSFAIIAVAVVKLM